MKIKKMICKIIGHRMWIYYSDRYIDAHQPKRSFDNIRRKCLFCETDEFVENKEII